MPSCAVEGCDKEAKNKGLCGGHYSRLRRHGDVKACIPLTPKRETCTVPGCARKHYANGYCAAHRTRLLKKGNLAEDVPVSALVKHGKRNSAIYRVWRSMINRCTNPKSKPFKNYGARGITVAPEWMTFTNFYADMGDPPPGLSLERIDNNLGYCKENCRWATVAEQQRNKRTVKLTMSKVEELRARYAEGGVSYRSLAVEYGVSENVIGCAIRGETWA